MMTTEPIPNAASTVLVVDDVPDNILLLSTLLSPLYNVKVATNGERALKIALSDTPPDLILLDIVMPGISGHEVCIRLKADERSRDIPVIFVTSKDEADDEIQGLALGAVDYLTKPLTPAVVLARVKTHLQLRQAERDRRAALDQQQELNAMRARFVAMTTHEFRTPLTNILSSQELLRHYGARLPEDEKADLLDAIAGNVRRMTRMLDRVLLLGQAEAQMLEFKPKGLDLRALLNTLVGEALAQYPDGPCDVRTDFSPELGGGVYDETLLRHIFGNLLSNAIKYSPGGGEVRFTVRMTAQHIQCEVSDQGIGIPEEAVGRLFESFHRASNVGSIQGTGLGLAIVKSAVDLHGGTITLRTQAGKGSCFVVILPRV